MIFASDHFVRLITSIRVRHQRVLPGSVCIILSLDGSTTSWPIADRCEISTFYAIERVCDLVTDQGDQVNEEGGSVVYLF